MEFFEEFERRFGDHIHILDWSLHLDESTPHIHDRPEFDKLIARLKEGDTLSVTKLDRIARTVEGGIQIIKELIEKHVKVNILSLGVIDNTPVDRIMIPSFQKMSGIRYKKYSGSGKR